MQPLILRRPDDWHLHVRDGDTLGPVLAHTAARFARAVIMPNLDPPVATVPQAEAYRERILRALPRDAGFQPLMTLYLTDQTRVEDIDAACDSDQVHAVKLYPAGATTNSAAGVTALGRVHRVLEQMQRRDLPLLVHGEVTAPDVDVFDREKVFIDTVLSGLCEDFPRLRIVFEHITTREAVAFVRAARDGVAATITAHHLLHNRGAMFSGGLRPHFYCLPVLKREHHREALIAAATSGETRFFLGTDSAPHPRGAKESACGCAGVYTAHGAIELYAEAFEAAGALDRLQGFGSEFGADFYRLARNQDTITLLREPWRVPAAYPFDPTRQVVPLRAGADIAWRLADPATAAGSAQ